MSQKFYAIRNSMDSDMVEFYTKINKQKILAFVVHQDCLLDIPHKVGFPNPYEELDDLWEEGCMVSLDITTDSTNDWQ